MLMSTLIACQSSPGAPTTGGATRLRNSLPGRHGHHSQRRRQRAPQYPNARFARIADLLMGTALSDDDSSRQTERFKRKAPAVLAIGRRVLRPGPERGLRKRRVMLARCDESAVAQWGQSRATPEVPAQLRRIVVSDTAGDFLDAATRRREQPLRRLKTCRMEVPQERVTCVLFQEVSKVVLREPDGPGHAAECQPRIRTRSDEVERGAPSRGAHLVGRRRVDVRGDREGRSAGMAQSDTGR